MQRIHTDKKKYERITSELWSKLQLKCSAIKDLYKSSWRALWSLTVFIMNVVKVFPFYVFLSKNFCHVLKEKNNT